jgi:hypothetical protein
MRTIKLKATINYTINIESALDVSEEDNRLSLHERAKELGIQALYNEGNILKQGEVQELYISDIDAQGNPIVWVRP